jgi:hypothetical protein
MQRVWDGVPATHSSANAAGHASARMHRNTPAGTCIASTRAAKQFKRGANNIGTDSAYAFRAVPGQDQQRTASTRGWSGVLPCGAGRSPTCAAPAHTNAPQSMQRVTHKAPAMLSVANTNVERVCRIGIRHARRPTALRAHAWPNNAEGARRSYGQLATTLPQQHPGPAARTQAITSTSSSTAPLDGPH